MTDGSFDPAERARQKQLSREADWRRLAEAEAIGEGDVTRETIARENSMLPKLDAKVVWIGKAGPLRKSARA